MLRRLRVRRARCAVAVAATLWIAGCGSGSPTPEATATRAAETTAVATSAPAASAAGTFVSKMLPYRIKVPAGWQVDDQSQSADSDGDAFVNVDDTERLLVGHGFPEAGETLADRVSANRDGETSESACTSNAKQDRAIVVGGERGVLWSYNCAPDDKLLIQARNTFALSAQTIYRRAGHRRVGYRFTVVVPLAKKRQARSVLHRFLSHLTFLKDSAATLDR